MRIPRTRKAVGAAAAFLTSSSRFSYYCRYLSMLSSQQSTLLTFGQPQPTSTTIRSASSLSSNSMICEDGNSTVKVIHVNDNKGAKLTLYQFPSVGSTQDEAKRLLKEMKHIDEAPKSSQQKINAPFAVSATEQTKGRGTKGRQWIGSKGNTFVTIAIPMKSIPVPLNLLPLKVGTIIASVISEILQSMCETIVNHKQIQSQQALKQWTMKSKVTVKWPNDVLIDGRKVSGVLIESEMDQHNNIWFIIGIGVNVAFAPSIESTGPHRGRKSTCLADHLSTDCLIDGDLFAFDMDNGDESVISYVEKAEELASLLAQGLVEWIDSSSSSALNSHPTNYDGEEVIKEWKNWAEFGQELILRDEPGDEKVITIAIENDGQLRVKDKMGTERLLVADYLL